MKRASGFFFFGDFQDEHVPWNVLAEHLGWRVRLTASLEELRELREQSEVPAVFLDCQVGSCVAGRLAAIKLCVPNARVVICYPISVPVLADELVAAGAFHSVPKPLEMSELKQSLGFVWEAWSRPPRKITPVKRVAAAAA